jgi:probable F420-dependent oxidoreductase
MSLTRPDRVTFGLAVPFFDHHMDYRVIRDICALAESSGLDAVWLSDHVTGPTPAGAQIWFETLTLLSNLAAHTSRVTLGTDVLVAAYRHPLLAAKMLTTLDVVSDGRLVVGVGSGYIDKEFADLGLPFTGRGRYADECLEVWRAAWSPGPVTHHGHYFSIDAAVCEPKPVQQPHPPVWIGGASTAALARVLRYGDGWHPIGLPLAAYAAAAEQLRWQAGDLGRTAPTLSYSGIFGALTDRPEPGQGRTPLSGDREQVAADIAGLAAAGARHIVFRPGAPDTSVAGAFEQVERIAELVNSARWAVAG